MVLAFSRRPMRVKAPGPCSGRPETDPPAALELISAATCRGACGFFANSEMWCRWSIDRWPTLDGYKTDTSCPYVAASL